MAFVKIENGTVVQKSFKPREGFVQAPDDVACGYKEQGGIFTPPEPSQETLDEIAKKQAIEAAKNEAKEDHLVQYLTSHDPAEIKDWVQGKLPSLPAKEAEFIARIAVAIGALYRSAADA